MQTHRVRTGLLLATTALLLSPLIGCSGCAALRTAAVNVFTPDYEATGDPTDLTPVFLGVNADRRKVAVTLTKVASGFAQPTDIAFVPGRPDLTVVLEKGGAVRWYRAADAAYGTLMTVAVNTDAEEGLLGIAFHPRFPDNGQFYLNYTAPDGDKIVSHVRQYKVRPGESFEQSRPQDEMRDVMTLTQPYPNHNAGQLRFGPDGYLYVGWGDGGWRFDPHGNGQNPHVLLGKMLRLDIDRPSGGKGYGIPSDNPFADGKSAAPEVWALGLRNPWRYAFAPDGRLIVADVGQDAWEEVSIVPRGGNMGWNVREAAHCFEPKEGCKTDGLTDPIYQYGHDEGQSITGGVVYTGARIPALRGKYVFGDFVQGEIWALDLPAPDAPARLIPSAEAYTLGKWPVLVSTFGQDEAGEVYFADFGSGTVYRLDAAR